MVNQNIQSPIVIPGPGFVSRRSGDLRSGEYKKLVNAEIKDGRIVNRRNIRTKQVTAITDADITNKSPIGYWNDWTIYSNLNYIDYAEVIFTAFKDDLTDSILGVPGPNPSAVGYSYKNEVGAFQYNNDFYILYWGWNPEYMKISYGLVNFDDSEFRTRPDFTTADTYIQTEILSIPVDDPGFNLTSFKNQFIYKDRLWIATEGRLYFSKATDFLEWDVVDGGGYFGFEGEKVNYVFPCNNIIYVICDSAIYVVTYNVDPNEDSTVVKISDSTGGLHGCEFRGTPYLINNDGIFVIYNNYLERVFNTDLDLGLNNYPVQTITPFIDYLVINKCYLFNTESLSPTGHSLRVNLFPIPSGEGDGSGSGTHVLVGGSASTVKDNENSNARTGSYSVRLLATNGTSGTSEEVFVSSSNRIKVQPGKRYMVSFYAKTAIANVISHVNFWGYDAAGVSIGLMAGSGNNATGVASSYGTRFYAWVTIPPDDIAGAYRYINAMCGFKKSSGNWGSGPDYMYLDDFLFEEIATNVTTPAAFFYGSTVDTGDLEYGYLTSTAYTFSSQIVSIETNVPQKYELTLVNSFGRDLANTDGNVNEYNLFFLNMIEKSLHVVDYKPIYCSAIVTGSDYCGFANGISVNPNVSNSPLMMTFSANDYNGAGGSGEPTPVAAMEFELSNAIADKLLEKTNLTSTHVYTTKKRNPQILIEKNSICPDGNEYLIKKYRNFEVMAKFPKNDFEVLFAYDNAAYGTALEIIDDETLLVSGEYRGHQPHRIGLNQRARELSIKLRSEFNSAPENADWDFLEISDMRLLWTYTNRAPLNRSFTPTV